ncbi:(Fe-S)-binding protein [Desulfovibrio cuneatus]|uniref:(Fe-S)-binding protein n=1 Tax=Desulfovibrio cuneatus TaxID=159728 RepID=UPI00042865E6|nr:(Fe-S)-binding protein [Desulfovibrio cuneatus]
MADVKQLVSMLQELDDNLVGCMRCGMCQAVCPVYGATFQEGDVTRGKIALLENLAAELVENPQGVSEKLNRCLLCGSCQANCPSGVKIMDIFLRARAILGTYQGFNLVERAIFRGVLQQPGLFNSLLDMGSKFQGLFVKDASNVVGTSCAPLFNSIIGDRHFPKLAKAPLHQKYASLDIPAGKSGLRVAFFPGCVTDKMFPNVGEACLKVFQHHGVGVFMPKNLACCGIPALASGDRTAYDKLVTANLAKLAQGNFDYLVTPCGTCTATLKEIWPLMADSLPADQREAINRLHHKIMDVTAFVVDVLKVTLPEAQTGGKKITYHDSCHLKKSLGVAAQPRKLLQSNSNYEFVEMAEADRCCGSGGSFTLKHYDLSKTIGQRKRDNIVQSGAQVAAAGCPACMMQMMDMLSHNHDNIAVKHVMEVYAESL